MFVWCECVWLEPLHVKLSRTWMTVKLPRSRMYGGTVKMQFCSHSTVKYLTVNFQGYLTVGTINLFVSLVQIVVKK